MSFGTQHLGQALFDSLAKNPGIELALEFDDRFVGILSTGAAARAGRNGHEQSGQVTDRKPEPEVTWLINGGAVDGKRILPSETTIDGEENCFARNRGLPN